MDRISKWAVAGSLAWLLIAVGVILGTHGGASLGARTIEAQDAGSAAAWSVTSPMEVESGQHGIKAYEFGRC